MLAMTSDINGKTKLLGIAEAKVIKKRKKTSKTAHKAAIAKALQKRKEASRLANLKNK